MTETKKCWIIFAGDTTTTHTNMENLMMKTGKKNKYEHSVITHLVMDAGTGSRADFVLCTSTANLCAVTKNGPPL